MARMIQRLAFALPLVFASVLMAAPAAAGDAPKAAPKGVFQLIFAHPDFVTFTILILSVVALTLIIQSAIRTRASVMMPQETIDQLRGMIEQRQFKELLEFTEADNSFVSKALNPALKRAPSFAAMKEAMETAVAEQTADAFRRIEYLNIIGNLGPLLGLLGTVLGMIAAFSAMQAAGGDANPSVLAGGISTALAHTFMGLFLAVPALAAFGVLRTITDRLTVKAALASEELLLLIKPAEAKSSAPSTKPQPVRSAIAAPVPTPSI